MDKLFIQHVVLRGNLPKLVYSWGCILDVMVSYLRFVNENLLIRENSTKCQHFCIVIWKYFLRYLDVNIAQVF